MPSRQELVSGMLALMQMTSDRGCTTLHDCGIGVVLGKSDLDLLDAVAATGEASVRYAGMLVSTHMGIWEELGLKPGVRGPNFHLTGIKAWSDGSVAAQTGFFREPYLGSESRGALNYTPEEIEQTIRDAHGKGWQVG